MSTPTITINISIEQINNYAKRISDDPSTIIEHDGILIDKAIMNIIESEKGAFIDDYSDLKKIYSREIHNPNYIDGDIIDVTMFASLPPQPYPSWIISDDLTTWEPPVKYPDPLGIGEGFNVIYTWNEETKQFENILPETPQPFPSWSAGYIAEQLSIGWIPPKPYPDGTGKGYNKSYRWNEDMLTWQDILV